MIFGLHSLALCLFAASAAAAEPAHEERTFNATVDGKPAGTFTMTWKARDGKELIEAKVDVKFRTLLGNYRYALHSIEVWEGGRLASLASAADDDGKKHSVTASAGKEGYALKADGKAREVKGSLFTTTGWMLPAVGADGKGKSNFLDAEDGTVTAATVERLADGKWGQSTAKRYKVAGKDLDAEWWFDAKDRPIRQVMVWDGHKVVIELASVKE